MFYKKNFNIPFHLYENQSRCNEELTHLQVLDSESVILSEILKISKSLQWLICGVCWIIFLIGSYFRSILYQYLHEQYQAKESKPIDILTLAITAIQQLGVVTHAFFITLMVATDSNLSEVIGQGNCALLKYILRFEISYSVAGSLGIAFYRLSYLKFHSLTLNGKKTCCYILVCGLAFSIICNILLQTNDFEKTLNSNCVMVYKYSKLKFLYEYEMSRGNDSIYSYWQIIIAVLGSCAFCLTTARFIIYIYIFYVQYKHDNAERLRRLLDPSVIRSRNQKNAITFFGQFCSFLLELSVVISIIIMSRIQAWYMVFILKYAGFAAISMVEVFTSNILRSRFFNG